LLTLFKSATVATPGTLIEYPNRTLLRSDNCSLRLNLERINAAKDSHTLALSRMVIWGQDSLIIGLYEDPPSPDITSSLVKECVIRSVVSSGPEPTFESCCFAAVSTNGSNLFRGAAGVDTLFLYRCVFRSDAGYLSDGISVYYGGTSLELNEVRIFNCETGIKLTDGNLYNATDLLIENCTTGISARNAKVEGYFGSYRFKNNTTAIDLVGNGVFKQCPEWCSIYSSGNTNDVILWTTPTPGGLTFTQVNSRTPMSNALTGACVIYYDSINGEVIESISEYDPTSSGLVATRYQTAIDELAGIHENTDIDTGTEAVDSFADTLGKAAFWDYVVYKSTNLRAGKIMACWDASGNTVSYSETSTTDIGSTADLTLSVDISSNNVRLLATAASDNWGVKVSRKLL
jgi:hypothetical protein